MGAAAALGTLVCNDENMLVIRGDQRVADIYLTDFMRLFDHFESRWQIVKQKAAGAARTRSDHPARRTPRRSRRRPAGRKDRDGSGHAWRP